VCRDGRGSKSAQEMCRAVSPYCVKEAPNLGHTSSDGVHTHAGCWVTLHTVRNPSHSHTLTHSYLYLHTHGLPAVTPLTCMNWHLPCGSLLHCSLSSALTPDRTTNAADASRRFADRAAWRRDRTTRDESLQQTQGVSFSSYAVSQVETTHGPRLHAQPLCNFFIGAAVSLQAASCTACTRGGNCSDMSTTGSLSGPVGSRPYLQACCIP
jgi:hypothetical protein